ncbi:MAG: hypothetical protein JSW27_25985 [Phycisphaerales bacterium]|nr:MAG: hypothetical protein JSW27_25985 [Phycisphaerales bacterium]
MFELVTYRCPDCSAEIHESLSDGQRFECLGCHRSYRVLLDESTSKVGFVSLDTTRVQEPLHLPRGSVRAIATLGVAGCCWVLMLSDRAVPGYLLGLLLTIIGYYFGFRQMLRSAQSHILDASAQIQEPLNLPGGSIRLLLVLGFAVCGVVLALRHRFINPAYLEFFIVLAGLVAGYFFARLFTGTRDAALDNLVNHAKGLLVLAATVALAIVLLTGHQFGVPHLGLTLACAISFYFGSRS